MLARADRDQSRGDAGLPTITEAFDLASQDADVAVYNCRDI